MSEGHTPGPWECGQESIDPEWWIVTIKGGLIVANVNAHHHQEANAHLIAAAPNMLEVLRRAYSFILANGYDSQDQTLLKDISTVLAKAEPHP